MAKPIVIPSLSAVKYYIGLPLGTTDWVQISQDRINTFAKATDDYQWIHCDAERAARESPWKTTIAHGYLTISLASVLLAKLLVIIGWKTGINTGIEKLRLASPVPAGSRVRMWAELKDARDLPRDGVRTTFGLRFEVEGASKPACIANVTYVYLP